ncbi:MAG: Zn-dependent exopeptidase M28 [Treponema sp.]|nr:Zn-dependent exopeptidase M28 [Treponema sp.]
MYLIPPEFSDFIAPDCNRSAFIQNYLQKAGLEAPILQMDGKNHVYVKFPKSQYNPMFRIKTVIAHYDRIGIGANDNSAAVFCLMEFAIHLSRQAGFHNIRLIFTDGEEIGGKKGVVEQGAFSLAQVFRRLEILNDDIFVFDCMGRGNIPVICKNKLPSGISKSFIKKQNQLELCAGKILSAAAGHFFTLPANYSDNAGFIVNGIPAVEITMLPSDEIELYLKTGSRPFTWQLFHTAQDNISNLTPYSFEITAAILGTLAAFKQLS